MKFKLDENIRVMALNLFLSKGFDAATVFGQNLQSASDRQIIDVCQKERRCLVTLDLDFTNPLAFKPSDYWASPY